MKYLAITLLTLAAGLHASETPVQIYDSGIRQIAEGKLADARTTFANLVDVYPRDPLAIQAKGAIDATLLFEEGQARVKAGQFETARVALETLIAVYPENPLAERAKASLEAIAGKEKSTRPVLQSLEFRHFGTVPVDEIRTQMEEREIRLNIGQPIRSKDVKQAKAALAEILAEKGAGHVKVEARMRTVSHHAVTVIFTLEKSPA
ncbi:MAG TPA: tetratricopeptide repeat protein [Bryobacteraceae bacterium]|nr:tetratricopeptide repeat protein [Bryobacteraceae bacterium]